jgi:hypothetical protein
MQRSGKRRTLIALAAARELDPKATPVARPRSKEHRDTSC